MSEQPDVPEQDEPNVSDSVTHHLRSLFSESGFMLTGLVALSTYINEEGARCFAFSVLQEQGPEVTAGLADVIQGYAMEQLRMSFPMAVID